MLGTVCMEGQCCTLAGRPVPMKVMPATDLTEDTIHMAALSTPSSPMRRPRVAFPNKAGSSMGTTTAAAPNSFAVAPKPMPTPTPAAAGATTYWDSADAFNGTLSPPLPSAMSMP